MADKKQPPFDLINPYWDQVSAMEDNMVSEDWWRSGRGYRFASFALAQRSMERVDLAIYFLDHMDLEQFRLKSGRLNFRGIAKEVNSHISKRNASQPENAKNLVREVGLRSMEMTIKALFSKSEKP